MVYFTAKIRQILRNNQLILALLAVIIGIIAGLGEVIFQSGIDLFTYLFHMGGTRIQELPWWQIVAMPTLGGLIVGLIIHNFFPEKRPQNVADVIEASAVHSGKMKLSTGLKAAFTSVISIGSGGSVGQEGPIVHLGSSLASWCAQLLNLPATLTRTILGCGIAGAVAAAFNAPIAGVFFALEVVIGHYALSAFTPVVIAAVTATMVSRWHYGDVTSFTIGTDLQVVSPFELPLFALLGIVAAFVALLMTRLIFAMDKAHDKAKVPVWLRPALGGLCVGMIGVKVPEVMGVGYETTTQALNGQLTIGFLGILVVLKIVATTFSIGSRMAGGIFSPSIFTGAVLGGFFGAMMQQAFGFDISEPAVYAVLGMGAVAGAIMGAPISTILIVFELTGNYAVTIALMVATGVASTVLAELKIVSFFKSQLKSRGLNLDSGRYTGLMRSIRVEQLLSKNMIVVHKDVTEAALAKALVKAPFGRVWIIGDRKEFIGCIGVEDVTNAMANMNSNNPEFNIVEVLKTDIPFLLLSDHLRTALNQQELTGHIVIPVVNNKEEMLFEGVIYTHDLLLCYQREIQRARAGERGDPLPPAVYQ